MERWTSRVQVWLERPSADSSTSPEWFLAEIMDVNLLESLEAQAFNNVAFLRYHVTTLMGVSDARVFSTEACREEDLADPAKVFSPNALGTVKDFWVRCIIDQDSLVALPIHPKDADRRRLSSRPPGDTRRWQGLGARADLEVKLRDLLQCQATAKPTGFGDTHQCHVIPHRRGEALMSIIEAARSDQPPTAHAHCTLDCPCNVVTLSKHVHPAWDNNELMLVPVPNVAMDSHGAPLPWDASSVSEPEAPAPGWEVVGSPMVATWNATRSTPVLRLVWLDTCSHPHDVPTARRLRGPWYERLDLWPAEWRWSYRLAGQVAARCKTPELHRVLIDAWSPYDESVDGSSVTGTSGAGTDEGGASYGTGFDDDDAPGNRVGQPWQSPMPVDKCRSWLSGVEACDMARPDELWQPAEDADVDKGDVVAAASPAEVAASRDKKPILRRSQRGPPPHRQVKP